MSHSCIRASLAATLVTVACFTSVAAAQESDVQPLTVTLKSGRTLTAPVDSRTDNEKLWLRFEGRGALLLRPIQWNAVTAATYLGEPVSLEQLKQLAQDIETEKTLVDRFTNHAPEHQPLSTTARKVLFSPPRITSLDFSARTGNWDADAADDGLIVQLAPLDANGRLAPASVRVEVILEASRPDPPYRENDFQRAQTWSVSVTGEELAAGTPIKLPFSPNHRRWGAVGRVTVRALAPGQGVFETKSLIRLQPRFEEAPRRSPYGLAY